MAIGIIPSVACGVGSATVEGRLAVAAMAGTGWLSSLYGPGLASESARYDSPSGSDAGRAYDTSGVEDGEESAACVSVTCVADETATVSW